MKLRKLLESKLTPAPETKPDPVTVRTLRHTGRKLVLRDLFATLVVEVGGEDIDITARGRTSRLAKLQVSEKNDTVTLRGVKPQDALSLHLDSTGLFNSRWSRWLLRRLDVVVLAPEDSIGLTIRVPEGTGLDINGVDGNIMIGDTQAALTLGVAYNQIATVGRVSDAEIEAGSSSRVTVAGVHGSLHIGAEYSSQVTVRDGDIVGLTVKSDSSSVVHVLGRIHDADVGAAYNSSVKLGMVSGRLDLAGDSSSDLTVLGGTANQLEVKAAYNSVVKYGGTAREVTLKLDSSAEAWVANVTASLTVNADYNSRLTIGDGNSEGVIPIVDIRAGSSTEIRIRAVVQRGRISADYNALVLARDYGNQVKIRQDDSAQVGTF